jgi:membrane-associated phospholipid phosphatase
MLLALSFVLDAPVERLLTLSGPSDWTRLVGLVSRTGEGWVVAVLGIVGCLFLFWRRRFDAGGGVFLIALTGLLTGAAATVIRSLLGRTRPSSHEVQGFYGIWHDSHWIIGKYEFGAFPSGHAATVIGVAAAAWLIDRRLGLLASVYALVVTWSRVALGCHHFSDAVAAAILGIAGAHVIFARLGPGIYSIGQSFKNGRSSGKPLDRKE